MTAGFWRLIDRTRPEGWDPASHAEGLVSALVDAGAEEVLRFATAFDEASDALYTWDLWGAAYLSLGGCGDDAFEYLRAWVIGAGEATWALARHDPEKLFLELLNGADDAEARWAALGIHAGEPLLYAAGRAYETLTGEWLPQRSGPHPGEPSGREWEERQLPRMFPKLYESLPEDSGGDEPVDDRVGRVARRSARGLAAFARGDHDQAGKLLEPIVDDPEEWRLVSEYDRVDTAYVVGMIRLLAGDLEGASTALRLVEGEVDEADHVRRALAQVDLARGDLDGASRWIDQSEQADPIDRALAAKLAWRQGERDTALRRATAELSAPLDPIGHPWDRAGSLLHLGQLFIEAGDAEHAAEAARTMAVLLSGAPPDLPLLAHHRLLQAGVARLEGRFDEALDELRALAGSFDGGDRAECLREQARAERALGHTERATRLYREAVDIFRATGMRWDAETTRDEAEAAG